MSKEVKGVTKDLGGFTVRRILPSLEARMAGPFVFLDQMGPAEFPPFKGIDVRPHPHIGLSTLSYLFAGAILHRDSLGNCLEILPGEVNWMTAGKGIVHSERESIEAKTQKRPLSGLQAWIALPKEYAEIEPDFQHVKREALPTRLLQGVQMRLVAGEAFDMCSPIKTFSEMFFIDVFAPKGSVIPRPNPDHESLLIMIEGSLKLDGQSVSAGESHFLENESEFAAEENTRCILLGGKAWESAPHLEWNFVAFDKDRMEKAKQDWRDGRFPQIPGDNLEHIPLPGED